MIFSFAGLTCEDVIQGKAPNVARLARAGSVGAMSVRTIGSRTDPASAFATIGAGNRTRGRGQDNLEYNPQTRAAPGGGLSVSRLDDIAADSRTLRYGAVPGTLGEVLHKSGLKTAVVGNADGGGVSERTTKRAPDGFERRRYEGLALADKHGSIDFGSVGDELVEKGPDTLNGYRANSSALIAAAASAIESADVTLVELADTYREQEVAFASHPGLPRSPRIDEVPERYAAIGRDDAVLGKIIDELDLSRDSVLVLASTGVGPAKGERLMVAEMAGVGSVKGGLLTSATTRRAGLITIADVGPGVLELLQIKRPTEMTGQPLHAVASSNPDSRTEYLAGVNETATFHLLWIDEFYVLVVALQFAVYLIAWRKFAQGKRESMFIPLLAVAYISLPLASLVLRASAAQRAGIWVAAPVLFGACALITLLAFKGPWRRWSAGPGTFVCAVTTVVIAADLLTGANLQMSSLVGYSPIVAGRFFGIGNLPFAVFGTSASIVIATLSARMRRKALVAAVLGAVVVILDGAPIFGADFGGIIALVCGFGVMVLVFAGKRLSVWKVLAIGVAAGAAALAMGYLDSLRPAEDQTHLGRFVSRLFEGGPGGVSDIIVRKALANWALRSSILLLVIPLALSFGTFLWLRHRGLLDRLMADVPGLKEGLIAAATVNLVGFAVNDSGLAIPAIGLAIIVPYLLATAMWGGGPLSRAGAGGHSPAEQRDGVGDALEDSFQGNEREEANHVGTEADRD